MPRVLMGFKAKRIHPVRMPKWADKSDGPPERCDLDAGGVIFLRRPPPLTEAEHEARVAAYERRAAAFRRQHGDIGFHRSSLFDPPLTLAEVS